MLRPLKIAIVSKSDSSGGGASRVAEDLANLINGHTEHVAHHWHGYASGPWKPHYRRIHGGTFLRFVHKAANGLSTQVGFPDFFTPELAIHQLNKRARYDLYHFHDISRTVSPISMRWIAKRTPVAWTFHDCSPFTGGCLYPLGCERFHNGCGECPQLDSWPLQTRFDATRAMFRYKKGTAGLNLMTPISPSQWMAGEAMKSGMFHHRPRVIPNCVDSGVFRPMGRSGLRELLGLPKDKFTVLLSSHDIEDSRKGARDALQAMASMDNKPHLVALGAASEDARHKFAGIDATFTGFVQDRDQLAKYYAAADALLFPTRSDNQPISVLEAMASGTPTIGYQVGGMPELVSHLQDGWLASPRSVDELREGIEYLQSQPETQESWSRRCRERAVRDFSEKAFVDAHIALYESMVDPGGKPRGV